MPLHTPARIDIGARGAVLLYYARIYTAVRATLYLIIAPYILPSYHPQSSKKLSAHRDVKL
jgi:hypothetical protein